MADQSAEVILGVDTHAQVHVACLLDQLGRPLGTLTIPVTTAGFHQLVAWASRHGRLIRAGVEGTGTYGAGLTRHLTQAGVTVVEVDRPNRQRRRRRGKSDPIDAEAAARAVLADEATTTPKARSGIVEAIRVLRVARTGAIKAAPRPPTSSAICWSPRPRSCTPSCTLCRPPSESSAWWPSSPLAAPTRPAPPTGPCATWPAATRS
jgi:hypothetical protein